MGGGGGGGGGVFEAKQNTNLLLLTLQPDRLLIGISLHVFNLPEGVGGGTINRDILLNAHARMVQFRTRPLVFSRDRSPVTSLCLKQQCTDIIRSPCFVALVQTLFFHYRASSYTSDKSGQAR